jgi:hypothetical protein
VGQGEKEDRAHILETTPPRIVRVAEAAGPTSHWIAGEVREGMADVAGSTSSHTAGVVRGGGAEAARLTSPDGIISSPAGSLLQVSARQYNLRKWLGKEPKEKEGARKAISVHK